MFFFISKPLDLIMFSFFLMVFRFCHLVIFFCICFFLYKIISENRLYADMSWEELVLCGGGGREDNVRWGMSQPVEHMENYGSLILFGWRWTENRASSTFETSHYSRFQNPYWHKRICVLQSVHSKKYKRRIQVARVIGFDTIHIFFL